MAKNGEGKTETLSNFSRRYIYDENFPFFRSAPCGKCECEWLCLFVRVLIMFISNIPFLFVESIHTKCENNAFYNGKTWILWPYVKLSK